MSISSTEQSIYDQEYYTYHLGLLAAFSAQIQQLPPFNTDFPTEDDQEFLVALTQLQQQSHELGFLEQGQTLMCRIVGSYPHLMPLLYRDLLWFFGGDCLHFMPVKKLLSFNDWMNSAKRQKSNKHLSAIKKRGQKQWECIKQDKRKGMRMPRIGKISF